MSELAEMSNLSSAGSESSVPHHQLDQAALVPGLEESVEGAAAKADAAALPDCMEAWPEIQAQIATRRRLLLALGFDGILSPTTVRPSEAILPDDIHALLSKLSASPRITLAILSGRSLSDMEDRIGLPAAFYVGNHGMQVRGPGLTCSDGLALSCRSDLVDALVLLSKCAKRLRGILIEDKGLTVAAHWRLATREERATLRELLQVIVVSHPRLEMFEGEACWELRARASWDKGHALRQILGHLRLTSSDTIYVGERSTGEDGGSPTGLTFRLGLESNATAQYQLRKPSALSEILFRIFYTVNGLQFK